MLRPSPRIILVKLLVAGIVVWLYLSALAAWKLTDRRRLPGPEWTPPLAGATIENHRLATVDGQNLGAWLVRGRPDRPCVLLLHGIGGQRGERFDLTRWLAEQGLTVMAVSLRGHGDSSGCDNNFGYAARNDVLAAVAFLQRETPGRPIYIIGHSLGAATAIYAAGQLQHQVAGYFLEQPYYDLSSAAWNRLHHVLPRGLDGIAYAGLRFWAPAFVGGPVAELSPAEHLRDIPPDVPVVFCDGSADRHAHLDEVQAMQRLIAGHAELIVFPGAEHVDLSAYDPPRYRAALERLLNHPTPRSQTSQ